MAGEEKLPAPLLARMMSQHGAWYFDDLTEGERSNFDLKAQQAQLNTDIKAVAAFEKQLTSLLASMPELCVEGCAADIEKCKKTAAAKKKELSDKLKASGGSQDAEEGEPPEPEAEPEPEK